MSKVRVTIRQTQTATFDAGDLPIPLIKGLLEKNDGSFDGNYALADVSRDENYVIDSVEVEQVTK